MKQGDKAAQIALIERALSQGFEAKKRKALEALETLENLGVRVRVETGAWDADVVPFKANSATKRDAEESWPDAVDRILTIHPTGLTVLQIAQALKAEGRVFPTKGRLEAPIANVVHRRSEAMGWIGQGRPKRWRRVPGGSSS